MTNYTSGRNFEYRIIDILKDIGYVTMRSAGSHGVCDILAARTVNTNHLGKIYTYHERLAIQAKRQKRPLSKQEMLDLISYAETFDAIPVFVHQEKPRSELKWWDVREDCLVRLNNVYISRMS